MTDAMPYFPADVEIREREAQQREAARVTAVEQRLAATGGRLGCPHPAHRMATVANSPARLILPECAGQEAWLAARMGGIGGSEIGALIGVSDYDTSFSVWNTKKHGGKDLSGLAAIEWGHRLEEVVAAKTADTIGMASRFAGGLWADRERDFLRVTPDRFATKPRDWRARALIECKTAGDDEHWISGVISPRGLTTGSAPLSYQAQAQWQMGIIGLPVCYLGCLVLGRERQFFTVEVHFDAEWFAEMTYEAERFWVQNVLGDEPPMHDFRHPKTEELLKDLHPNVVVPSIQLPGDADEWAKDLRAAQEAEKEATARVAEIKNYFRMHMADAGVGYLGDRKLVSYPEVKTTGIDVAKLREEFPEVAEQVTRVSHYRRMTIRTPK
jgi:putative phage-type endonuclease